MKTLGLREPSHPQVYGNLLDLLSPGTMLRALPGDVLQSSQEPHETGNSFVPIRTPSMDG